MEILYCTVPPTNKQDSNSDKSVLTLSPLTRARVDKVRVEIAGLLNIVEHFTYPFDFLPVNCNYRSVKRINKIIMALQYSGVSYVTRVIMTNISTHWLTQEHTNKHTPENNYQDFRDLRHLQLPIYSAKFTNALLVCLYLNSIEHYT